MNLLTRTCELFLREIEEHARRCQEQSSRCSPPTIPDRLDERHLASALRLVIAGTPADGSVAPTRLPSAVVWTDHGDEVLVHLDSLQTRIVEGKLLASLDLETDQTGRTPLVLAFALGAADDPAGLVATTEVYPRGNALLASRWGEAVQATVWRALLDLTQSHALERRGAPRSIAAVDGLLVLQAGPGLKAS